jgi:hypothetical protein
MEEILCIATLVLLEEKKKEHGKRFLQKLKETTTLTLIPWWSSPGNYSSVDS